MAALTIIEVKLFCRITHDVEDSLLESLMSAATNFVLSQTGKTKHSDQDIAENELFKQCVKMLVAHWYDNRGAVVSGQVANLPYSVETIIAHIKLCGDFT